MQTINSRDLEKAITVLKELHRSVGLADIEMARKITAHGIADPQSRRTQLRVMERLQSIEESITELRRWSLELQESRKQTYRHGAQKY